MGLSQTRRSTVVPKQHQGTTRSTHTHAHTHTHRGFLQCVGHPSIHVEGCVCGCHGVLKEVLFFGEEDERRNTVFRLSFDDVGSPMRLSTVNHNTNTHMDG